MKSNVFGTLVAGAVAGFFLNGTIARAQDAGGAKPADAKGGNAAWYCQNSCKGTSACKGHGNDTCKGQNSCKGKGSLDASNAKDCKTAKGKWTKAAKG